MSEDISYDLLVTDENEICMVQCKASCCRDPYILILSPDEIRDFKTRAVEIGVDVRIQLTIDGSGWIKFAEHVNQSCPMLDSDTSICRIYKDRPNRCRTFPDKLIPGCAISGA